MVALPSCYRHVQGRTHSPGKTLSSLRGQEAEGKKVHEGRGMKHTLKGTAKVTCFLHLGPLPNDPTNSKQWLGYESVNESSGEHGAPPPPDLITSQRLNLRALLHYGSSLQHMSLGGAFQIETTTFPVSY